MTLTHFAWFSEAAGGVPPPNCQRRMLRDKIDRPVFKFCSWKAIAVRGILLLMIAVVSLVGFAGAQEMTGRRAEKAKQEVLKIEQDKLGDLLQNGSEAADWFDRYDDDGMINAGSDGNIETKTEHEAKIRSKQQAVAMVKQYDYRIHMFANANIAIVTYKAKYQRVAHPEPIAAVAEDVWINKDGKWLRILHSTQRVVEH